MAGRVHLGCVLLAGTLGAACTVSRSSALEAFACAAGGPCTDGGARDGGVTQDGGTSGRDARVDLGDGGTGDGSDASPDAGTPPDAGPICIGSEALPTSGRIEGTTINGRTIYDSACVQQTGAERVYEFTLPGRARWLEVEAMPLTGDTVVHLYRNSCAPTQEIGCNDDVAEGQLGSFLELTNVPAGRYAVVVDSFEAGETGAFNASVIALLAPGEPCDPRLDFAPCAVGECALDGEQYRCPELLDCADGLDGDEDGEVDEDGEACEQPMVPQCTPLGTRIPARNNVVVDAAGIDGTGVLRRWWDVVRRPSGDRNLLDLFAPESARLFVELRGLYRLRHTVVDTALQVTACEARFDVFASTDLHVELVWNPEEPAFRDDRSLVLHFLHPSATSWFDAQFACYDRDCDMLDWDMPGRTDDATNTNYGDNPAVTYMPRPTRDSGPYSVGVGYRSSRFSLSPARPEIRIICRGQVVAELRGATITLDSAESFWKAADITIDANGNCAVSPINELVSLDEAGNAR